jgi:hypothetical protein
LKPAARLKTSSIRRGGISGLLGSLRRGLSIPSQVSLEYWIARSSRAMTVGNGRISRPSLRAQAKQSMAPRKGRLDCFVALLLAMTWLKFHTQLRILAAGGARGFAETSANQRAQGMPGAQCTRSLACDENKHTSVVTTVTPESSRHSPRNGFTAYAVLSPATSSCCHRHSRIKGSSNPVELDFASANLTPATGARTIRFCRTQKAPIILHASRPLTRFISPCDCRCAPDAFTSTASRPALVTTRDRPSGGTRQRISELIWVGGKQKHFCKRGLTPFLIIRSDLPVGLICRRPNAKI